MTTDREALLAERKKGIGSMHVRRCGKRTYLFVTFRGATKPLPVWCRALGISQSRTRQRLMRCGWSVEKAFLEPGRGGGWERKDGYRGCGCSGLEHRDIAEKAIGKSLPVGAEVHHVNGIRSDNRNANLVICQDREYHTLLHRRQQALEVCGHAHYRRCPTCNKWDDPARMIMRVIRGRPYVRGHRVCVNAGKRRRYNQGKGQYG